MHVIDCIGKSESQSGVAAPVAGGRAQRAEAVGPRILVMLGRRDGAAAEVLRGVAHYQQVHRGWSVQVDERSRSAAELHQLFALGWDGVVSCATTPALVAAAAEFGLPLVALDGAPRAEGLARIRTDQGAVGAMAAECLIDRGFANLAFVGDGEEEWARERREGFVEAARLAHHDPVVFAPHPGPFEGAPGGDEVWLANWLVGLPKPLGVMAVDDRTALRVLAAARRGGMHVPGEVAVLGADNDVALCELAVPSLTSVALGAFQQGFLAAEHLDRRLSDPALAPCDLCIDPVGIVGRRSTDILAIPDRTVAAAVRLIAAHACAGATVEQVAQQVGASRSQLERKFRRYLGRSPQAEIRRVQISKIRQLLADTDLPHKHIAELTGFEYMEYMCVVFRRVTGQTMGAFRRSRRLAGQVPPPANALRRVA